MIDNAVAVDKRSPRISKYGNHINETGPFLTENKVISTLIDRMIERKVNGIPEVTTTCACLCSFRFSWGPTFDWLSAKKLKHRILKIYYKSLWNHNNSSSRAKNFIYTQLIRIYYKFCTRLNDNLSTYLVHWDKISQLLNSFTSSFLEENSSSTFFASKNDEQEIARLKQR